MAPTRSKKRKSTESPSSVDMPNFPAPPIQAAFTKDIARTPSSRSPIRKAPIRITVKQKQALIDNLQLEITERARKLRAQYTMQAQGLRTRIEIRVNRIPMSLRRANMGELFVKQNDSSKQEKTNAQTSTAVRSRMLASPSKNLLQETQNNTRNSPSPVRMAKRLSDEITDKENEDLSNPKKRVKATISATQNTSRAKLQPNQVLSPRSANSRTLPRSPVRPAISPGKSYLARPVSPLKPAADPAVILTNMVEKAKSTRATATRKVTASSSGSSAAVAGRGRRVPQEAATTRVRKGRASNSSQSTEASSSTTVVTKARAIPKSPVKKTVMGTIKGIGAAATRKPAASKAAPPTRVLRKRA